MAETYCIEKFWKERFAGVVKPSHPMSLKGWSAISELNPRFVEADLVLRTGFSNVDSPIWLVAAPGAVGKSTFARQLAASTGSVFLDLALSSSVAGNYLSGGLANNGLSQEWKEGRATVLVDALDEAKLRVTPASFEDFLADVAANSRQRQVPLVFFGRTGVIEEAWMILSDNGFECPIFEVQFFNESQSLRFVIEALEGAAKDIKKKGFAASFAAHRDNYIDAADRFLSELRKAVTLDGDRFAGYAPVLQAIASVLAEETNPSKLDTVVLLAKQSTVLKELSAQILVRESGKLRDQLKEDIDEQTLNALYKPNEQLDRLSARILQVAPPNLPSGLTPNQTAAYEGAMKTFFDVHPFLDGAGKDPSGAVFSAAIVAHALGIYKYESAARAYASGGLHTPNPFLINFCLEAKTDIELAPVFVPPEHVPLLYESLRAGAKSGDIVRLQIDAGDEEEAEGEISVSSDDRSLDYEFVTSQAGTMSFARSAGGISIQAPLMDVSLGNGEGFELAAPTFISVARLFIDAKSLVVVREQPSRSEDPAVVLEATGLGGSKLQSTPTIRNGVELSVCWPDSTAYPWSQFSTAEDSGDGSELEGALRRLRRLVLAFRSHSKGRLARLKAKIEHARMTKGDMGDRIRNTLIRDKVLSLEGKMYFLDAKALGSVMGTSYLDVKMKRYSEATKAYLKQLL